MKRWEDRKDANASGIYVGAATRNFVTLRSSERELTTNERTNHELRIDKQRTEVHVRSIVIHVAFGFPENRNIEIAVKLRFILRLCFMRNIDLNHGEGTSTTS